MPTGLTPGSTGGIGEGKWFAVNVSDVLRKDLAKPTGGQLVGLYNEFGEASTVKDELDKLREMSYASSDELGSRIAAGETIKIVVYGDSTVDGTNTTSWTANPTDSTGNAVRGSDHNLTAPNTWHVFMQNILQDIFGSTVIVRTRVMVERRL